MSEPRGNGPTGPQDDLAALAALDLALDELAAGDLPASPIGGEAAVLAAVAAGLRAAVPAPPPGAAERGRAAFLARAAELQGTPATTELPPPSAAPARRRRRLPARVLALAAALLVLAAVPAAVARQARPGSALWPVRQVGQQLRVSLADDPARRAHLRLNIAEEYLAAGAGAGERRRKAMADRAEDLVEEVIDQLEDVSGARAGVERARAERLLLAVRVLEHQDDPGGGSGPGSGSGSGDQSGSGGGSGGGSGKGSSGGSGPGGGDDGGGSGSKSGSSGSGSGSGSGSSGSGTSGSGDD
jgi:hypothetical protein